MFDVQNNKTDEVGKKSRVSDRKSSQLRIQRPQIHFTMNFLWNHWFWITAALVWQTCGHAEGLQPVQAARHASAADNADASATAFESNAHSKLKQPSVNPESVLREKRLISFDGGHGGAIRRGGLLYIPNQDLAARLEQRLKHRRRRVQLQDNNVADGPLQVVPTSDDHSEDSPSGGAGVSVSRSVSKVSVKVGDISIEKGDDLDGDVVWQETDVDEDAEQKHHHDGESVSSIFLGPNIDNHLAVLHPTPRRLDPQFLGYNLVYQQPKHHSYSYQKQHLHPQPSHYQAWPHRSGGRVRPVGLLQTILEKLKSLAIPSRISISNRFGSAQKPLPTNQAELENTEAHALSEAPTPPMPTQASANEFTLEDELDESVNQADPQTGDQIDEKSTPGRVEVLTTVTNSPDKELAELDNEENSGENETEVEDLLEEVSESDSESVSDNDDNIETNADTESVELVVITDEPESEKREDDVDVEAIFIEQDAEFLPRSFDARARSLPLPMSPPPPATAAMGQPLSLPLAGGGRSLSRGRSLPLPLFSMPLRIQEEPGVRRKLENDITDTVVAGQTVVTIKEVKSQEWADGWEQQKASASRILVEHGDDDVDGQLHEHRPPTWKRIDPIDDLEVEELIQTNEDEVLLDDENELVQQADFIDDFTVQKQEQQQSDDDGIRIEVERMDPANISAIIGVVVGIIIFVIISIVLVLFGLQQTSMKKAGPAEDVISQSSYMTYSTTVSDNSVNYGPNWDKDMVEDLCSLDNDSFLNSLEAVTTTDYWADPKYS